MNKVRRGLDLLAKNEKEAGVKEVIGYFEREHGEVIGIIAAENILNFFLDSFGPVIYNRAIDDLKAVLRKQLESLDFEADLLKKQK